MTTDRETLRRMRALCEEICDEDGMDPRLLKKTRKNRSNHRAKALCKQVAKALNLSLASAQQDSLRQLCVLEVQPMAGSSRLRVMLYAHDPTPQLLLAVQQSRPWLREEVARAIRRKRVPDLFFDWAEVGDE